MDEAAVACYEMAVQVGKFDDQDAVDRLGLNPADVPAARRALVDLGLLVTGDDGTTLISIDPGAAESALTIPLERDIAERKEVVARIRDELRPLAAIYAHRPRSSGDDGRVRVVDSPASVVSELTVAARRCRDEVLTMQPGGGRGAKTLEAAVDRDRAMLAQGVTMRILYQHTARASAATRRYVRLVTNAGARVRTAVEIPDRLIVFDRKLAFVPSRRREGKPPGAVIVTEPALVSYLCRGFENTWLSGADFDPDSVRYEQYTDELRTSIMRLMALGHKDAVIARRLGMSTRTCRRYISSIAEELGATSRFQAGARAAELGLLPEPDASDDVSRSHEDWEDDPE
jgi:DNA-binding CsgD family transcriptional regulator